jgi:hypothetical protein
MLMSVLLVFFVNKFFIPCYHFIISNLIYLTLVGYTEWYTEIKKNYLIKYNLVFFVLSA